MQAPIEQIVTLLSASMGQSIGQNIPWHFGNLEANAHHMAPTVFWVPTAGRIGAPINNGGRDYKGIFTKTHSANIVCWASTRYDADALHDNVLRTIRVEGGADFKLGTWRWMTEDESAGWTTHGAAILQQVTVDSPVLATPVPLANIQETVLDVGEDIELEFPYEDAEVTAFDEGFDLGFE